MEKANCEETIMRFNAIWGKIKLFLRSNENRWDNKLFAATAIELEHCSQLISAHIIDKLINQYGLYDSLIQSVTGRTRVWNDHRLMLAFTHEDLREQFCLGRLSYEQVRQLQKIAEPTLRLRATQLVMDARIGGREARNVIEQLLEGADIESILTERPDESTSVANASELPEP